VPGVEVSPAQITHQRAIHVTDQVKDLLTNRRS